MLRKKQVFRQFLSPLVYQYRILLVEGHIDKDEIGFSNFWLEPVSKNPPVNTAGRMLLNRFESGLFKTNEDITPHIRGISKTFVWWRTQTTSVLKTLRPCGAISLLALDVFKLGKIPNFKRYSFRKCRWIFAYWSMDGSILAGMLRMYILRSLSQWSGESSWGGGGGTDQPRAWDDFRSWRTGRWRNNRKPYSTWLGI